MMMVVAAVAAAVVMIVVVVIVVVVVTFGMFSFWEVIMLVELNLELGGFESADEVELSEAGLIRDVQIGGIGNSVKVVRLCTVFFSPLEERAVYTVSLSINSLNVDDMRAIAV